MSLQKPFSQDALCNAVKKAIESAPTDSLGNAGEVSADLGAPPEHSRNATRIGSIILLFIVIGAIIYLSITGH
jgi:hypothetical protein